MRPTPSEPAHAATAERFRALEPWITRFEIDGRAYGGHYDAAADARLAAFDEHFPAAAEVLELGSLEGGHSFALARRPGIRRVLALEGRRPSLARARCVQALLGERKVEFHQAQLERAELARFAGAGHFDALLCLGVLYHLRRPWRLLQQMRQVARGTLIWTHYCLDARANWRSHWPRAGYRGRLYPEWRFLWEPLSGMVPAAFWPTRPELLRMLGDAGWGDVKVLQDDPAHEHGPAILLVAR